MENNYSLLENFMNEADSYINLQKFNKAIEYYDKVLKIDPKYK